MKEFNTTGTSPVSKKTIYAAVGIIVPATGVGVYRKMKKDEMGVRTTVRTSLS